MTLLLEYHCCYFNIAASTVLKVTPNAYCAQSHAECRRWPSLRGQRDWRLRKNAKKIIFGENPILPVYTDKDKERKDDKGEEKDKDDNVSIVPPLEKHYMQQYSDSEDSDSNSDNENKQRDRVDLK